MLLAVLSFLSCSKDNSLLTAAESAPANGRYIYTGGDTSVAVDVGGSVNIEIYKNGLSFYQNTGGLIRSAWPVYEYVFNDLVLICTYSSSKSFNAYLDHNRTGIDLPRNMQFKYKE